MNIKAILNKDLKSKKIFALEHSTKDCFCFVDKIDSFLNCNDIKTIANCNPLYLLNTKDKIIVIKTNGNY